MTKEDLTGHDFSTPQNPHDAPTHDAPAPEAADERLRRRISLKIKIILIAFLLCFLTVAAKLFLIQITNADYYREIARKQYESKVSLAAERGNIYDRKRRLIATTVQKLSVAADPKTLENATQVCRALSAVTGVPAETYLAKIRETKSSFVWLERAVDSPAAAALAELDSMRDAGLIKAREPRRSFAYGSLAAQALGFTDSENKGASGVELGWDSVLCGRSGYMFFQRDGRGKKRPMPDAPSKDPEAGRSLVLTLDMDMQSVVESELQQGVASAEAESGMAVVIKPSTGEILAMASAPTFDPNRLSGATPELTRNRCFTDMYEPGSTFKLVTAAALLNEGRIKPESLVNGSPELLPRGVTIKDDHSIGEATFARSIELSSNIVVATLSQRLSNPKFFKYVRDFGFGIYSGIDVPGEVRGIVKKPHEFDATTKLYMAHGYQLAATPLQIANAYAAVANGGVMMRPYLVQRVLNSDGGDNQVFEPQKVRRIVSDTTTRLLTELFCGVVERGTGTNARIPGMRIAGKTGTAQKLRNGKYSKEDYTASFAGFFPAEHPEAALLVMLHNPRKGYYGSQVSAPIFQKIAQKLVAAGLVSPGNAAPEPSADEVSSKPAPAPDLRGLRFKDASEAAQNAGFKLKPADASGIVQDQKPKPGASAKPGSEITVTTTQPDITVDALPNTVIPDVRGMTLRRALTLLHAANIKTKVLGQGGVVYKQEFKDGKEPLCVLDCRKPDAAPQPAEPRKR